MENEGVTVLFVEVAQHSAAVTMAQVETVRRKETVLPRQEGPADLLGFLLLGASAMPILDLGVRLGWSEVPEQGGLLVLAAQATVPLAFRVDRVEGPVLLPWNKATVLPQLLRELQSRPAIWGLAWRSEALVPLLDLGQLVPSEELATLLDLARQAGST